MTGRRFGSFYLRLNATSNCHYVHLLPFALSFELRYVVVIGGGGVACRFAGPFFRIELLAKRNVVLELHVCVCGLTMSTHAHTHVCEHETMIMTFVWICKPNARTGGQPCF